MRAGGPVPENVFAIWETEPRTGESMFGRVLVERALALAAAVFLALAASGFFTLPDEEGAGW